MSDRPTVHERDRLRKLNARCARSNAIARNALSIIDSGAERYPRTRLRRIAADARKEMAEVADGKYDAELL